MRSILILIWVLFGVALFLPGCRASLSGENLEAVVAIQVPGTDAPENYEGRYDEVSNKPE